MAKYEITDIEHPQVKGAFRIKALKSFSDVKAGDLGGYVDAKSDLSQRGKCWLYGDSVLLHSSRVEGDAKVVNSTISSISSILGNAVIINGTVRLSTVKHNGVVKDSEITECIISDNSTVQNKSVLKGSQLYKKSFCHNASIYYSDLYDTRCIGSHLYNVAFIEKTTVYGKVKLDNDLAMKFRKSDGTWPERIDAKLIKEFKMLQNKGAKRFRNANISRIPLNRIDAKTARHLASEYSYNELATEYEDFEIRKIFDLADVDF